MIISASILSADFSQLQLELEKLSQAKIDLIHLDVMDGNFVPNLTFGFDIIKTIKQNSKIPLDVHLMVSNPESYIERLANIGVEYITFHYEAVIHSHRLIMEIKRHGIKVGIAIVPSTPAISIENIIDDLDMILVMSVNPGFGGQKFIPSQIKKIQQLKRMITNNNTVISVDGGVNQSNILELKNAGADIVIMGSALYNKTSSMKDIVEDIHSKV
ncbi:MAG: ribulose-phosphate 3-epimerase [Anaplasmataceae bacterium]|nr:ribulose-phosphate 3-epimerase [Anaplasmataceae bacterium]